MQLRTGNDQKELKSHGSYAFPVFTSDEALSHYERFSFSWHWHPEIELTYIQDGDIDYQVNDQHYFLSKGQGLFCNTNVLHTGKRHLSEDCHYISITFRPRLISGFENSIIDQRYLEPLLQDLSFSALTLSQDDSWQSECLLYMQEIHQLNTEKSDGFEMLVIELLLKFWYRLFLYWKTHQTITPGTGKNLDRLRTILHYMQEHYAEPLTLEDISASVNLCKSECCRFFKHYMKESIFDYLLNYRIEKSLPLLLKSDASITDIAARSGFSSSAYYTKIFKRFMYCTPKDYRKKQAEPMLL